MKLSIGMMVKNEAKHLEECLESLTPIREEIDSELVIVDTGSSDNTVEIAEKFTDKVYFHEWNDHFSEMRNKVISYTSGEWYFSLDGDEIVANPEEIIDFLQSPKSEKYNAAFVIQRNFFSSDDKSKFGEAFVPRLFRNDDDFHFEGAIHNQPQYKKPTIKLEIILNHYGYNKDDEELMEQKFQRTAGILKRELEKDPKNIYYNFQLSKSYAMHGEQESALEYIEKAYNLILEKDKKKEKYIYVYVHLIKMLFRRGKYKKAIKRAQEVLKIADNLLDVYYYLASAQLKLQEYESAKENFEQYIKFLNEEEWIKKRNKVASETTIHLEDLAYSKLIAINSKLDDYEAALSFVSKIEKKEILVNSFNNIINIYLKSNNYEGLKKYFLNEIKEKELVKPFLNRLEAQLKDYDNKEEIIKVFAHGEDDYNLLNKLRLRFLADDKVISKSLWEEIKQLDFNYLTSYYGDIIYYVLVEKKPVIDLIKEVQERKLNKYMKYLAKKYNNYKSVLKSYIKELDLGDKLDRLRLKKLFYRYLLAQIEFEQKDHQGIFTKYIKAGTSYLQELYSQVIINKEKKGHLKNKEEAFLLYMYLAEQKREEDLKASIKYLKKALDTYPKMHKGVEILLDELKEELAKKDEKPQEFKQYQKRVKENIKNLIQVEQLGEAKELLKEYKEIVKKDIDIYSMQGIIAIKENKLLEAENILKQGLKMNSNDLDLLYNLAYVQESQEDYQQAIENYQKILELEPDSKNQLKEKIEKLEKKKSEINKKSLLDKKIIKEFRAKNYKKIINKIKKMISQRNFPKTIAICRYWNQNVNSNTGSIYYFLGVAYNGLKKFDKAIKCHKKALEIKPSLADLKNKEDLYQKNYEEQKTDCIGCGSDDYEIVNVTNQSKGKANKEIINPLRIWVKCNNCGLVFANPIPKEESLKEYYSLMAKGDYSNVEKRFEFLIRMSNKRLEKIEDYSENKNKLLDIGTGVGFFVGTALDRGWDAEGLELTSADCQYAKEEYGLNLIQKDFYEFNKNIEYDVVTLFEVIEHLKTPFKALEKIYDFIKKDGILVVATPILDSLYAKKKKEKNVFWTTVEHLTYFTTETLTCYLEKAGFEVLEINLSQEGMGRMEFYCRKK